MMQSTTPPSGAGGPPHFTLPLRSVTAASAFPPSPHPPPFQSRVECEVTHAFLAEGARGSSCAPRRFDFFSVHFIEAGNAFVRLGLQLSR